MTLVTPPRVAVVGAGDIGCGWAALVRAAGWPVALFDPSGDAMAAAPGDVRRRVDALARLGRAAVRLAPDTTDADLRLAPSLLQAVADADWIVEAAPEELGVKQRLLEQIEQVARRTAVVTSSTSGFHASALSARLRHPERLLVAHPLNPVELIPVIELVPGPATDPAAVDDVRSWLLHLRRAPIVLKKEVPGNAVGRIAAAVWRECIALVLEGVVDVADVDRLVALGPSLGWAAAGPHLTYHLGAGEHGVAVFVAHLLETFEAWWAGLATWTHLTQAEQTRLVHEIERAYGHGVGVLRRERDERLARILTAIEQPPPAEGPQT